MLIIKKASFPAVMTIISLLLFIAVYWALIKTAVEPYYFEGLVFAIPFVCFGIVTYLVSIEKISIASSIATTVILIVALGAVEIIAFILISIDAGTTETTDAVKYERVLELTDYPNNPLTKCFPNEVPSDAKNIEFSYYPAFMQGGEDIALKFKIDSDSIKRYVDKYSDMSMWAGKIDDNEAEDYGVITGTLNILGYTASGPPDDLSIYVIYSKPYRHNDWNHGELSLIAISEEENEIMFLASDW